MASCASRTPCRRARATSSRSWRSRARHPLRSGRSSRPLASSCRHRRRRSALTSRRGTGSMSCVRNARRSVLSRSSATRLRTCGPGGRSCGSAMSSAMRSRCRSTARCGRAKRCVCRSRGRFRRRACGSPRPKSRARTIPWRPSLRASRGLTSTRPGCAWRSRSSAWASISTDSATSRIG